MRISSLLAFLLVLGVTPAAFADGVLNDCKPNDEGGCACEERPVHICEPPDMSFRPYDFSVPRDLTSPPDARRERRRRKSASARGLVLLSGLSTLALVAIRRRYRTTRPTPAENALAASATRKDS